MKARDLGLAFLNIAAGVLLGLLLLEIIFHINPTVLPRGMELSSPVDQPIVSQTYEVFSSDADLFFWHSDLIEPVQPEDDSLEANVNYHLDQFGFPNRYPQPERVEIVVLGRSFSMGAQASSPWIRQVETSLDVSVLNLAQAGGGISSKMTYLQKYGLPRSPEWVILEVLPSLDILAEEPTLITQPGKSIAVKLPLPVIQLVGRALSRDTRRAQESDYIYPLKIDLHQGEARLTFFIIYLEALTVSPNHLHQSQQWSTYSQGLNEFVQLAKNEDICLALLLAPTKPEVYFPISLKPEQLNVITSHIASWKIRGDNMLYKDLNASPNPVTMQHNAQDQWSVFQEYANLHSIPLINPIPAMQAAASESKLPFMQYDSHWSALGHQIIADLVIETLNKSNCR